MIVLHEELYDITYNDIQDGKGKVEHVKILLRITVSKFGYNGTRHNEEINPLRGSMFSLKDSTFEFFVLTNLTTIRFALLIR